MVQLRNESHSGFIGLLVFKMDISSTRMNWKMDLERERKSVFPLGQMELELHTAQGEEK